MTEEDNKALNCLLSINEVRRQYSALMSIIQLVRIDFHHSSFSVVGILFKIMCFGKVMDFFVPKGFATTFIVLIAKQDCIYG